MAWLKIEGTDWNLDAVKKHPNFKSFLKVSEDKYLTLKEREKVLKLIFEKATGKKVKEAEKEDNNGNDSESNEPLA